MGHLSDMSPQHGPGSPGTAVTEPLGVVAFIGVRLVLREQHGTLTLPRLEELVEAFGEEVLAAGRLPVPLRGDDGAPVPMFGLDDEVVPPDGFRADGLRVAWHGLHERAFRLAGTARQKVEWFRTHRFCSRCGAATVLASRQDSLECPACGQTHFPRIAPAAIVLIQRGEEALLGRSPHFPPGVYSTLAGFVEPGESLEECVHREIYEEVGVHVTNLRYFGSQPHPFPHSLMVGFTTDWLDGDIRIDPVEIEDARWFHREELPELPHRMSIARALIEDFVQRTS